MQRPNRDPGHPLGSLSIFGVRCPKAPPSSHTNMELKIPWISLLQNIPTQHSQIITHSTKLKLKTMCKFKHSVILNCGQRHCLFAIFVIETNHQWNWTFYFYSKYSWSQIFLWSIWQSSESERKIRPGLIWAASLYPHAGWPVLFQAPYPDVELVGVILEV